MFSFRRRASVPAPEPQALAVGPALPDLSRSAKQVLRAYEGLPPEHRPAYDVEAMLRALDLKHGNRANGHLEVYDDWDMREVSLNACNCVVDYDYDGCRNYDNGKDGLTGSKCAVPEYRELYDAMGEIHAALAERERVLAEQAKAAELAGLQYEFRCIADLTAELRRESSLIREVTDEIFVVKELEAR